MTFFKSQWTTVRANSALFTGLLLANLTDQSRRHVNVVQVTHELMKLLRENSATVRSRTARALSNLYNL